MPGKKSVLTSEQLEDFKKELDNPYWGQLRHLANVYGVKEGTLRQLKRRMNLSKTNVLNKASV